MNDNATPSNNRTKPPSVARAAAVTASCGKPLVNPYKKPTPFVGGAQRARLQAQKRSKKGTRILRPHEREQLQQQQQDFVFPRKVNVFERFFGALLRSSAIDVWQSQASIIAATALWETQCRRVGLTTLTQPLQASYDRPETHFSLRAALVLEEARNALAQPLCQLWKTTQTRKSSNGIMVTVHYHEPAQFHTKISFRKQLPFTKEELFHIRPGSVFECQPRDAPRRLEHAHLACVGGSNRETVEKSRQFTLYFFRPHDLPDRLQDADWIVTPLNTLITELRQFEAMTCNSKIGFLSSLLGTFKRPTHIRFDSSQEDNVKHAKSNTSTKPRDRTLDDYFAPKQKEEQTMFSLPRLNASQETAASTFLQAEPNSITLVQGPPGTGKTTLLVSVICRYVLESLSMNTDRRRRLLVCAPTNKAISVLASRFLASIQTGAATTVCNPILVGDADKLLAEDSRSNDKVSSSLRSIFCFSWMATILEDYRKIRNYFVPGSGRPIQWTKDELYQSAVSLETRLANSLDGLPKDILQLTQHISSSLASFRKGGAAHGVVENIERLCKALKEMQPDLIWRQLLASADVIFCTLASAGGLIFKSTARVDDLIVDEAAAATEPELCIPFHLRPSRLLAVGDPLQLPATVLSRRAAELGLAKSLHERLMYECGSEHVMLNVQYRMNPEISAFPSARFYDSKIADGSNVQHAHYGAGAPRLLDGRPYIFLQVDGVEEQGFGGSYKNLPEARAVLDLVKQLRSLAQQQQQQSKWHSTERIRIITFYQAQVGLLKRLLREQGLGEKIIVATVDSSQGCEADIVIVSFVRSQAKNPNGDDSKVDGRHAAGFLTDNRRVNVALTRAKYQLICVGNVRGMSRMKGADTLQLLAADAGLRQVVRPYPTQRSDVNSRLDLFYDHGEQDDHHQGNKRPKLG